MLADLHLHSTASDGTLAPAAVVELAAAQGMQVLALTDHDSVDGIAEARQAAAAVGIAFIPGVELGCEGALEVHILGYGLDAAAPSWQAFFAELQAARKERVIQIVHILSDLGFPLDEDEVRGMAAHSLSRSHVARALVHCGAVSSVKEAFTRFLQPGRPAYVPRAALPVAEITARLRRGGAVPVLAHPGLLRMHEQEVFRRVLAWQAAGLLGIEAHYPAHTPSQVQAFEQFARAHGLLVTGGSDFHGEPMRANHIGEGQARWTRRSADVAALWQAAGCTAGRLPTE